MNAPKNSAEPYEMLLNYEIRHGNNRGVSGSPRQRGTRSNEFNYFPLREFRNENDGMVFMKRLESLKVAIETGMRMVEAIFKTVVLKMIIILVMEAVLEAIFKIIVEANTGAVFF